MADVVAAALVGAEAANMQTNYNSAQNFRTLAVASGHMHIERMRLDAVFKRHTDSASMNPEQVKCMLQEANGDVVPTEDEVNFILAIADLNKDGDLQRKELDVAVRAWSEYISMRHHAQAALDMFAVPGTVGIQMGQLKECLMKIAEQSGFTGKRARVSDEDVRFIWMRASVLKREYLCKPELNLAMLDWQEKLAERKQSGSQACAIS
eukprot:TRINITY_DN39163_c0_g1_i1.p1 TRINITY_DN39163_c0_g1~~TRINITY_DN39163_c0_g1_i1.p1  ORF type:complete len:208 (+),score=33.47 TRINITY_DN39163_c0_g1_i1:82-705(+)